MLPQAKGRELRWIVSLLVSTVVLSLVLCHSAALVQPQPQFPTFPAFVPPPIAAKQEINNTDTFEAEDKRNLVRILKEASLKDKKTVIVTMMNQAWAEPNSTFDVFLEGFFSGERTELLLRHLVVVCLDDNAYAECLEDMDTVWLRDPFPRLVEGVDFQIACEFFFNGNFSDRGNSANGGFKYVTANNRTIDFYNYWYESRLRFPGKNDQDVLNRIKGDQYVETIGLTIRFLDTNDVGSFCQQNWDITKVCVMHGNCCIGQDNKIMDLRQVLRDWTIFYSYWDLKREFRQPLNCRNSFLLNLSLS
ncbi:unnamed protein product [Thlaspi arvense]|uniref:Nucleotide-diphospho-sugar transferase domain-containing protein n=1 Tax=Thlaspi arvense TaxID=13288 RepID=A0AAU9R956_THLAR|nr:unnamed protein product [Thlaspi arvense]